MVISKEKRKELQHRINLKGCVDRGFYYYGTLKSTFRIQTHSEIDTSTTSGHPLSFLFNEPLEFHWIRQWKLNFKVRPAQPCPTSPFCHIEICLHSAWQCVGPILSRGVANGPANQHGSKNSILGLFVVRVNESMKARNGPSSSPESFVGGWNQGCSWKGGFCQRDSFEIPKGRLN